MNGADLIALGHEPGPHFGKVLGILNRREHSPEEIASVVAEHAPAPPIELRDTPAPCQWNITADTDDERTNVEAVRATMDIVLRTPIVEAAAIMPDACPAGPIGTIPVGGVVGTRGAIVPGMHSADICCSLMMTVIDDADPAATLDAAFGVTHFGPGGRCADDQFELPTPIGRAIEDSPMFDGRALGIARRDLGTQGDGNHFAYVGRLESSGQTVLVTHHGSRGLGALLYKTGKRIAEKRRAKRSPATAKANAWIDFDTQDGRDYWDALQIVRDWTKAGHEAIHDATLQVIGRRGKVVHQRWNEHNFVFRDGDTFWHAKGATPVHDSFLPDTDGVQIVPLNMAEPILLIEGERTGGNLGFAPHGAGRNRSRTKHMRALGNRPAEDVIAEETRRIDARFWCGIPDLSELPSAYKNATSVQEDMERFGLARTVDRVLPHGSIMAGDWEQEAPWRKKKTRAAQAARA